jgi:hypothetical protein
MARALDVPIDRLFLEKVSLYEEEILRIRGGKESAGACDEKQARECREQYRDYFDAVCRKCSLKPATTD